MTPLSPGLCPGWTQRRLLLCLLIQDSCVSIEYLVLKIYIGFRNSVSTASSFRGVSAKRRPGGTLCFLFQSKGHTICKNGIAAPKPKTDKNCTESRSQGLKARGQGPKAKSPFHAALTLTTALPATALYTLALVIRL